MNTVIAIMLTISWLLGMLLTIKMDRMFTNEPMRNGMLLGDLAISLLCWYIIAIWLLITPHTHEDQGCGSMFMFFPEDDNGRRKNDTV